MEFLQWEILEEQKIEVKICIFGKKQKKKKHK